MRNVFLKAAISAGGLLTAMLLACGCRTGRQQQYSFESLFPGAAVTNNAAAGNVSTAVVAGTSHSASTAVPPNAGPHTAAAPSPKGSAQVNFDPDRLRPGEALLITFLDLPTPVPPFEGRIRADGTITLMQNQEFVAAGKTVGELEKEIRERYVPQFFQNLTVVVKPTERFFYVDGQVRMPSRQQYLGRITVLGAIAAAGGFTDFAQQKKVRIQRADGRVEIVNCEKAKEDPALDVPIYPGDKIFVPRKWW